MRIDTDKGRSRGRRRSLKSSIFCNTLWWWCFPWQGVVGVGWRRLTFAERSEIARLRDGGRGVREIARAVGRSPSSISREVQRNVSPSPRRYRALPAHLMARERGRRPKPFRLAAGTPVRAEVVRMLRADYSPWEIEGRLRLEHPGDAGEPRDDLPGAVRAGQGQPARRDRQVAALRAPAAPAAGRRRPRET